MTYTYDIGSGSSLNPARFQKEALQIEAATGGNEARYYLPRGYYGSGKVEWSKYSASAYPIMFSKDMYVTGCGIEVVNIPNSDTFIGGQLRTFVYSSGADGLPLTLLGTLGQLSVPPFDLSGFGSPNNTYFLDCPTGGLLLNANKRYWVGSQNVLSLYDDILDTYTVDYEAENFNGAGLRTILNSGEDPMLSYGSTQADFGYGSQGSAGLYINDIVNAGWSNDPADLPATLTGTLNAGLYPTYNAVSVRVKGIID